MEIDTYIIIRLVYLIYAIVLGSLCIVDIIKLCNGGDATEWVCGNCGRPVNKYDSKCPRCKNELHKENEKKNIFTFATLKDLFNVIFITTIVCYDEFIKSSNNNGFLLQTI